MEPVVIESEEIPARNKTDSLVMDIENMSGYIFLAPPCEPRKEKKAKKPAATKKTAGAAKKTTSKKTKTAVAADKEE